MDKTLTWDYVSNATGYKIYTSTNFMRTWSATDVGDVLTHTLTGLPDTGLVVFYAAAYNTKFESNKNYSGAWTNNDWGSSGVSCSIDSNTGLIITVDDSTIASWEASHSYTVGDKVRNNKVNYKCITAGTSGSSEPTWDTTVGNTFTDGTVTWVCLGYKLYVSTDWGDNWALLSDLGTSNSYTLSMSKYNVVYFIKASVADNSGETINNGNGLWVMRSWQGIIKNAGINNGKMPVELNPSTSGMKVKFTR